MTADKYDWEWQGLRLKLILLEIDGDAFEELFQTIAKATWGSAFQATIPMGRRGDLKCDGFRADTGYVYQCYGPRYGQVNVSDALNKMETDFKGAKEHWQELMKKWFFVVGVYQEKLPSELLRLVLQLSNELQIPAEILHRSDIVKMASSLPADVRSDMFGGPPVRDDMIRRVTYQNIGRALAFIRTEVTQSPIAPVLLPPDISTKILFNDLPATVRHFLAIGTSSAERVRNYIADRAEPEEAARMAEGFSARYYHLRSTGIEPGEVFKEMLIFAGGAHGDPDRDAAALAIITHYFSTCEIFDRPPVSQPP